MKTKTKQTKKMQTLVEFRLTAPNDNGRLTTGENVGGIRPKFFRVVECEARYFYCADRGGMKRITRRSAIGRIADALAWSGYGDGVATLDNRNVGHFLDGLLDT